MPTAFPKIDFVEFIGRKEFPGRLDIEFLLESSFFRECVGHYRDGLAHIQACADRVSNLLQESIPTQRDLRAYLPTIIKWVGYRSELSPTDKRYVEIPRGDPTWRDRERRSAIQAEYNQSIKLAPAYKWEGMSDKLLEVDHTRYLAHWKLAYPEAFENLISDRRCMSRLRSAAYHGPDHVIDIVAATDTSYEADLPHLGGLLRLRLFYEVSFMLAQNLLCLDFDSLSEYPEFFDRSAGWWKK